MVVICLDVGTTVIKAVAFDERGQEVAAARQSAEMLRSKPGHAEQDMFGVWNAAVLAVRSVVEQVKDAISFIAITAQGDGCWLVDQHGQPTGPAVLWNDSRARDVIQEWKTEGVADRAFQLNGSAMFSGLPHAILAWMRKHDAKRLDRSTTVLSCNGWIFLQMTGRRAMEESDASAPFFDIRRRSYSKELPALYGLPWLEPLLPDICSGEGSVSPLQASAANELGLKAGILVVMAPYDVASMAIGAGVVRPGQACSVLGTTICTEVVKTEVDTSGTPSGLTLPYPITDLYLRAFPTLAGAEVFSSMQKLLGVEHPRDLGKLGNNVAVGSGGLLFLPYLSPSGERMPFFDPAARGTLFGLSFAHDRSHVARAVLEGLSMVIRDCLHAAAASPDELFLCGGGAQDDIWCRMIADCTNLPASCTTDVEVGAKGAFIAGMVITGAASSFAQAAKDFVKTRVTYQPDRERSERYADLYGRFRRVREIAKEAWQEMDEPLNAKAVELRDTDA